jgi:hypothetical protein
LNQQIFNEGILHTDFGGAYDGQEYDDRRFDTMGDQESDDG